MSNGNENKHSLMIILTKKKDLKMSWCEPLRTIALSL